jgi:E3 ubiquitin-protein ligase TRIP12
LDPNPNNTFFFRESVDDPLFDTEYKQLALRQLEKQKREQSTSEDVEMPVAPTEVVVDKKRELLESHPTRVRRLGQILFPTLIEVYSSTVHHQIRQRAIIGLVKLAYFSDDTVLKAVLKVHAAQTCVAHK